MHNNIQQQRGFTLIELIVVIAIISILAGVVLTQVNSVREKADDGAIETTISQARTTAELYYDDNSSSYDGLCATLTSEAAYVNERGSWACNDDEDGYAITGELSTDNTFHCVDSTGVATTTSSAVTTQTECSAI